MIDDGAGVGTCSPSAVPVAARYSLMVYLACAASERMKSAPLFRFLSSVLSFRRQYLVSILSSAFYSIFSLGTVFVSVKLLESVFETKDYRAFAIFLAVIAALMLLRAYALFLSTYYVSYIVFTLSSQLKSRIFSHLQSLSYSFFDKARSGDLMSRITNDVITVENFFRGALVEIVYSPITLLGALGVLFYKNWRIAILAILVFPILGLVLNVLGKKYHKINRRIQDSIGDITSKLQEGISTVRVVQSFCTEDVEAHRFSKLVQNSLKTILRGVRINAILQPAVELVGILGVLLIIAYMGYQVLKGYASFTDIFLFAGMVAVAASPINKVARLFTGLVQNNAALQRVYEILDTPPAVRDYPEAVELSSVSGRIEFNNVFFSYDGKEPVLLDFSFTVEPGQSIAIVGASGSGKSTILNLIPRFYEPQSGAVLIDGQDVRNLMLRSLRRQIGIVSQETVLFHGTLRDNICYGVQVNDELEMINAAKSANAHTFIMEMPDGYDTVVGERGVTLSGGERQRIAIARVLLMDPKILLLDEATSALDSISETIVQDALDKLMLYRTTLIVSHRLSAVRKADLIVVLKDGRIVESGGFRELLDAEGYFTELIRAQYKITTN